MPNKYISFLGTNDYLECRYAADPEEKSHPVRFVQEATLSLFAKDAGQEDRAYIFLTNDARQKNWEDDGQWDRKNDCLKKCQGLRTRIQRMDLPFPVEGVTIPDGHDEEQIWDIFDTVYQVLKPHDEIVFDITHAFRSIPMIAIIILNYSKVLKDVKLRHIHYGAFEALGPPWEVSNKPVEDRVAPLLDLTPLATLSDWITAIDRFIGAGDAGKVATLARQAAMPVMAKSKGKDAAAKAVKGIADALGSFSGNLSTCRGPEVVRSAAFVKEALSQNMDVDFVRPLVPLLKHVKENMSVFNENPAHDGIQAAKWSLKHGMIQQGFTILQETLISFVLTRCGMDELDEKKRTIVSNLMGVLQKGTPESEWKGYLREDKYADQILKCREVIEKWPDILGIWQNLTNCRNDMNHAGYRKNPLRHKDFEPKLESLIEKSEVSLMNSL